MPENNYLNYLLTNIAANFVVSIIEQIVLQDLVEKYLDILRIIKCKQTTCNLHRHDSPKISKNEKSKNGLPRNKSEKNYQRHLKPNSFNVSHTKMCNRRKSVNKLSFTNKDILKHMTNSFFSDQKVASLKTEPKEILLSKHKVIDANYKFKTVELNDSSLITDAEKCVKSEPEPFKTIKQNDSKGTDSDETQPLDLQVKQKQFSTRPPIYHVYMTEVKSHPHTVNGVPWNLLNAEKWRLVTFAQYPHTAQKSAILLANGGFAYYGSGRDSDDTVICYFCARLKRGWLSSDDIQESHRNLSPDCCMVTGANCNNIPMTVPVNGETLFFQFYNPNNTNGNTIKGLGYNGNNEFETDSAEPNAPATNKTTLVTPAAQVSRDVASGHVSQFTGRADNSSTSMSQEATRPTTAHNQPANSGAPSGAASSNISTLNSSSASVIPNRTPASSVQQGSTNNISSTETATASSRPGAAVQSSSASERQHVTEQTATSPPHVNQSTQNSAPAVGATAPTVGATAPTVGATAPTNQSSNQPQGNSTESTTGSSQNAGQSNNKGPTYGELGIITERPKRFEYAVTATRFASFEHWPRDHPLKKEDLSAAGFYYAGYGDCARCFYCGGGLRNWEDDDNVWVEHARWFPKCAYIRQTIGQQFVDTVQDLNKSCDKITYTMVTDKMGSTAASFQLDTRNMPLKRDPAVLTVMEMGYDEQHVIEAANYVKEKYGVLSSDKVFEKVLEKVGKSRGANVASAATNFDSMQKLPPAKEEKEMKKLKEENGQLRQQTVCKICMDKEVAVVFLPCGHFVSCTDCAAAMKDCPVCRKQVRGIVRAFMG